MENTTLIKIDYRSVIKVLVILLILGFLWLVRDIILMVFVAILLASIFSPLVDVLERKGISRFLGTSLIYLIIAAVLITVVISLVPLFSQQINNLINKGPQFYEQIFKYLSLSDQSLSEIVEKFLRGQTVLTGKSLFRLVGSVFGIFFVIFSIFVIAFYITVQKSVLRQTLSSITPEKYRPYVARSVDRIQHDLGAWGRGLLILCLSVGIMDFIGLMILKVNYPLVLALIAGLTEAIPWVGPWLGGIPAVLIALTQSPIKALFVAILFLAVQQIENSFLTPHVMQKAVGLNPLLVIIIVLIGGKLIGPVGVILAVPTVTILIIIGREYWQLKKDGVKGLI